MRSNNVHSHAAQELADQTEDAELGALLEQSFSLLAPLVDQADA